MKPGGARAVVSYRPYLAPLRRPAAPGAADAAVLLVDGHEPAWSDELIAGARAAGVTTVLDAGSFNETTRALARQVDHVVASEPFARALLGAEPTLDGLTAIGRPEATVVVTLGERGLRWRRGANGDAGSLPAYRVETVDTTGAGDAFHGAYALALARRLPWGDVLREASAAGALACTRFGGRPALPGRAALEAFLVREMRAER